MPTSISSTICSASVYHGEILARVSGFDNKKRESDQAKV